MKVLEPNRTVAANRQEPPREPNRPLHMFCIPLHYRGTRASTGFRHFQAQTCTPALHPQPCCPASPTLLILLLLRRSNECRFPSHHTETAHALHSPALPRARGGVQVFSTFRLQMFQNLYSPASAAQHPQPCLFLLRRSNECRFPSHHTETSHALYSPALPRARGEVQVLSTFRP